jgi:hypothetical protein
MAWPVEVIVIARRAAGLVCAAEDARIPTRRRRDVANGEDWLGFGVSVARAPVYTNGYDARSLERTDSDLPRPTDIGSLFSRDVDAIECPLASAWLDQNIDFTP